MNKTLFFIPARGGSKGLPGKNMLKLNGKPMLWWTVKAAIESGIKGDVVVSTDSKAIASAAKKAGAAVPFLRPSSLAKDATSTMDVVLHFLQEAEKRGQVYTEIILLQPTSPLRDAQDVKKAYAAFRSKKANSIISVYKTQHSAAWTNTVPASGAMDRFLGKQKLNKNRQSLGVSFSLNGAVYIAKTEALKKYKTFFSPKSFAFEMSPWHSVDVDTLLDFEFASFLMKKKSKQI